MFKYRLFGEEDVEGDRLNIVVETDKPSTTAKRVSQIQNHVSFWEIVDIQELPQVESLDSTM